MWLRAAPDALTNFRNLAQALQIQVRDRHLEFLDRIVILARASVEQLASSIELLDTLAELRRAKDLASFFTGLSAREQGEWVDALAERINHPGGDAPAVCLLDTGVNRGHPLLRPLIAPDDGQVMGEHWAALGYGSPTEFAAAMA